MADKDGSRPQTCPHHGELHTCVKLVKNEIDHLKGEFNNMRSNMVSKEVCEYQQSHIEKVSKKVDKVDGKLDGMQAKFIYIIIGLLLSFVGQVVATIRAVPIP